MKRLVGAALLLSCGAALAQTSPAPTPPAGDTAVHPERWPSPKWPIARDAAQERRIAALVRRMSVEEKVGQVIQADLASVTPDDVRRYHLGSVLNGGNSGPGNDDLAPAAKWLELADAFYAASVDKTGGRTAVPLIWGTDAVHGHSNIVGATLFPHNVGLGAMRDPALIERIGQATAKEIRVTGQEWTFAPTVTVPRDWRWGRAYEGYSSDAALVSAYTAAMVRGLQGAPGRGALLKGPHVLASTKHFLADGGTTDGRDQGDARISEAELISVHGAPYVPAIEQGVQTVMTSFSSWNGLKIAGNKGLVTDVLKGRMNFDGFVVTDWNAHGQLPGCTNASCPGAINAGIDMYMAPDSWRDLYASLLTQVKAGEVPMARLDDAVSRILRVKMRLGLFEAGKPSARPFAGQYNVLGAPEHRALAREAVRKSLVLLKNSGSVLPIKAGANVLVAGDGADDVARQSGGWTLTWQGTGLTNANFPRATSIWSGIDAAVKATGGRATLAPDGRFTTKPDVAIVVFGETPYAEFQGDIPTLQLKPEQQAPIETMRRLKAEGVPVVAVMLTGRPLYVNPALNAADAFVVAWLPGSEGAGVADMLVPARGQPAPRFTGKLPVAWPVSAAVGAATLYPFGYGLTGAESATWTPLPENSGVAAASDRTRIFARGSATPGWSLEAGGTRVTQVPVAAGGGRIRVTAVDGVAQESGRRFDLSGAEAKSISLTSQEPVDYSRETNGDVLLLMRLRHDQQLTGPVTLSLTDASKTVTLPFDALTTAAAGQWRTIGVPLKCFQAKGADMTRVRSPMTLLTKATGAFSIDGVSLGTAADTVVRCN
ncbi:exo-1,4-beta-glucosidase [Sphingomonas guangdongensis]|uniref:Exo-1,4-beta-glucosidase n=1 Tax=Sphingomonas guangdongensis TaxID=1141890 RepID=A0A285R117_9SPHN|nr:glycoside hydrolase family 3 protein [Sphingomonas guangdongensis]SOB87409.1 exo-1,4-beta-glucosidase [Sphingomonas guangdongensis]